MRPLELIKTMLSTRPIPCLTLGRRITIFFPSWCKDDYFGMPDETRKSRRNSWFYTSDIAKLDENGFFYFVCRQAERIRVKGEMVSGFEVEEGILSHPNIEDSAVVGIESPLGEEEIKALVVPKPNTLLTTSMLHDHCKQTMAKHMLPAR